jgi:cytochrome c biogenesis protein ResB
MKKFQSIVGWASLVFIIALTGLSIYSAFIGPYESSRFFSRIPLIIYWLVLIILLILALIALPRPGMILINSGCILILAGAIAGSQKGQFLIEKYLGIKKVVSGEILISEQPQDNVFLDEDKQFFQLPFSIKLKQLRLDYHKSGQLFVRTPEKQSWQLSARAGNKFTLDPNVGTLKILKVFRNFRIKTEDEKQLAYDSNDSGSNPAVYIEYKTPKGSVVDKYIFAKFPNPVFENDKIFVDYVPNIKQVSSVIEIIKDNKVIKTATIQVNHPMHYGGYHFYQHNYDAAAGRFSAIGIVSDTGFYVIYAGYALLCAGVFWQFWLRHLHRKKFISMT